MPVEDQAKRAGRNVSLWEATSTTEPLNPLRENTRCDVCIVGAGIAGLSIAYTLTRRGHSVVVMDDGMIGRGMTARTTAHLVNALDDRYYDLEKFFGEDGAQLAAQSHSAAIDRVEQIVKDEKIDCEFERLDGYLFEPPNESLKNLEREFEALRRCGLDVEWGESAPIADFYTRRAIRFPRPAPVYPFENFPRPGKADA